MVQTRKRYPTNLGTRSKSLCMVASMTLAISACTMSETQQRVGSGAAIGAAGGAIAGGLIGGSNSAALVGAGIGAAAGAGTGYVVDQRKKREEAEAESRQLRADKSRMQDQAELDRLRAENERLRAQQQE